MASWRMVFAWLKVDLSLARSPSSCLMRTSCQNIPEHHDHSWPCGLCPATWCRAPSRTTRWMRESTLSDWEQTAVSRADNSLKFRRQFELAMSVCP